MTVANEFPSDMDTTICAVLCTFLFLLDQCESTKPKIKNKFIPIRNICESDGICTNVTSYPMNAINKLLTSKKNFQKFQHLKGKVIEPTSDIVSVKFKFADHHSEMNVCNTRRVSKAPKVLFDTKKKQKFIVNTQSYKQWVIYETCANHSGTCSENQNWPNDIQTSCKQAYSIVRLVSVSHGGKLEYGFFPVPSSCVCSYKKI